MKTSHTPGPLIAQHFKTSDESIVFESGSRNLVATYHGPNREANAVLGAAAPELLAALVALLEAPIDGGMSTSDAIESARAAIATALPTRNPTDSAIETLQAAPDES